MNFFAGFSYGLDVLDPRTFETARLRKATLDAAARPVGIAEGYVVHDERFGLAVPPQWRLLGRVAGPLAVYFAPGGSRSDPARYRMTMGLALPVTPDATVVGVGALRDGQSDRVSIALDWTVAATPRVQEVALTLLEPSGSVAATTTLPLAGAASVPSSFWRPGEVYREYYELNTTVPLDRLDLLLGAESAGTRLVGPLDTSGSSATLEAEDMAGLVAVPDQRALQSLNGWGSYAQQYYSRGRAAITRSAGARATAAFAPGAGSYRIWIQVYSYGPGRNELEVALGDRRQAVAWRSGEPGLGRVAVELRGVRDGAQLELVARAVGQPYLIVDALAFERLDG
jgi:hypothetical protein